MYREVQSRPCARRSRRLLTSQIATNVPRRSGSRSQPNRSPVESLPKIRTCEIHGWNMVHAVLSGMLVLCLLRPAIVHCGTRPRFVSDEMIETAASVVNACQTQTGVATVDIEAVRNGQWPETRQLKCYMYCLWEQFGLVDDKRELNLKGMLTFFQRIPAYRNEVQEATSKCKGIGKYLANGDNCEYAYAFNKCYAELSPQTYYLF